MCHSIGSFSKPVLCNELGVKLIALQDDSAITRKYYLKWQVWKILLDLKTNKAVSTQKAYLVNARQRTLVVTFQNSHHKYRSPALN